jgi:hypothetical protein
MEILGTALRMAIKMAWKKKEGYLLRPSIEDSGNVINMNNQRKLYLLHGARAENLNHIPFCTKHRE